MSAAAGDKKEEGEKTAANMEVTKPVMPQGEEFSFNITFDATGAAPRTTDIAEKIKALKKLCYYVNGTSHIPNFLKITWGSLIFKCTLTTMNVNVSFFDSSGNPLRAVVDLAFKEIFDLAAILKTLNSPDMSHMIEVKQGDNLPNMCERIYGDQGYYLQVAEANEIVDFRNLVPGQKILFPRIDK
jgi:nucleoid-associated protein YgaU